MSIAVERLARLAGAGKPITGEGHSTAPTDPMLIAASLPSGNGVALEISRLIFMGDPTSKGRLMRLVSKYCIMRYQIPADKALGLANVALKSLEVQGRCKSCKGTKISADQKECKHCDGSGLRAASDNARARYAGIPRETFRRNYAEVCDQLEQDLQGIYNAASAEIKMRQQCA